MTTDQKLKKMRIMGLRKQLEYNKGLFMYRVLKNDVPEEYISYAIPTLGTNIYILPVL